MVHIAKNKQITKEEAQHKKEIKKKQGEICVYCGCTNPLILTIDHIVPLSRKGKDEDKNKQVCCFICNQLKGPLNHEEFLGYFESIKNLFKLHKIRINNLPQQIGLSFMQQHHPDFIYKREEEKK